MSIAASISLKAGFYEKLLLSALEKMELGTLNLLMPDGRRLRFGHGTQLSANMAVRNSYFFKRCVLYGDVGFGESYVAGEWDTDDITNVIKWFLLNIRTAPSISGSSAGNLALNVLKFVNEIGHSKKVNSLSGSKKNIAAHYDLNNEFFALFLDPTMTYSSAYFKAPGMTLEQAQLAKYERLCKQLRLQASDHVLEIGTGWGGNAIYIAKTYGCKVTSVTISDEQYKLAKEKVKKENLEDKVAIVLKDYRLMEGQFDKIVSIEMLEAVGADYYNTFFRKCYTLLKQNGLFALQVITCPDSRFNDLKKGVDWIQKHIFPGSLLPSVGAINKAVNSVCDLTLVDLKEMGHDYAHTLKIWHTQFNSQLHLVKLLGFDDTFIRKWNYYLCICEAAFAMRHINVMQMVYSRPNNLNW